MKYIIVLSAALCLSVTFNGQINELQVNIGDKLPDAIVSVYEKNKMTATKLEKLQKEQFLIIDFFATWCAPCIGSLDSLNKIANTYEGQLQIVPVTSESEEKWRSFTRINKIGANNKLPVILKDRQLQKWFPHTMVPHEIWIDNHGVVRYITSHDELNRSNFDNFISNKPLLIKQKKDVIGFNLHRPLQTNDSDFIYRSVLTGYIEGIPSGYSANYDSVFGRALNRVIFTNRPLLGILYAAFKKGQPSLTNFTQIELDVSDSAQYISPSTIKHSNYALDKAWNKSHTYCYDRYVPSKTPDSIFFRDMIADINALGFLKASVVKRKKPVWLLINTIDNNPLLKTDGKPSRMFWNDETLHSLQNTSLRSLIRHLNFYMDNFLVIDETAYNQPVDMIVDIPPGDGGTHLDISMVQAAVRKYGLDLVLSEREIDVLRISDKP